MMLPEAKNARLSDTILRSMLDRRAFRRTLALAAGVGISALMIPTASASEICAEGYTCSDSFRCNLPFACLHQHHECTNPI